MVFREITPPFSTFFLPSVQSVAPVHIAYEQTGQRGQVEVDHSLAAMFQTAEVRSRMLQLLLWHPEKWETQDVGVKPSVTADQRAVSPNTNRLHCYVSFG